MKKILFAASEGVPFIKTGGLADVVGALPKYIKDEDWDVRIILPKFACIQEEHRKRMQFVTHFFVELGWRKQYAGIFQTEYDGVIYYFIDNEYYFAGEQPYGQIYEDVEKFAFFSKAVLDALEKLDFCPDIIHCHDWQTGLVPVYLKEMYQEKDFYANIKTIYSIHNMRFQGRWKINAIKDATGLPEEVFDAHILEAYGESNYLKGGILCADCVTTVSDTYAKEIMTKEGGEGLDGLLCSMPNKLYGIENGIDYELYNPATDHFIHFPYTKETVINGKMRNKEALQRECGLPVDPDVFVIGMVSRMTDQKGFDLVAYILNDFLQSEKVQFTVLGTGEEKYEEMFRHFAKQYPDKISVRLHYSEDWAMKIYSGADAFLMPSLFEPCGLSQLISLRYGTVPIVRQTGGLIDTVEPYNEYTQAGTGFGFLNYNAHEMLQTIHYAMQMYYRDRNHWYGIVRRGMGKDFSWRRSAAKFKELYHNLSH